MSALKGPFGVEATISSDTRHIRHINADLGEGKPYATIADVRYVTGLTQEENLAVAELLGAAPRLRDALRKAEAVLSQIQDHPDQIREILTQGYFAHALIESRKALSVLREERIARLQNDVIPFNSRLGAALMSARNRCPDHICEQGAKAKNLWIIDDFARQLDELGLSLPEDFKDEAFSTLEAVTGKVPEGSLPERMRWIAGQIAEQTGLVKPEAQASARAARP